MSTIVSLLSVALICNKVSYTLLQQIISGRLINYVKSVQCCMKLRLLFRLIKSMSKDHFLLVDPFIEAVTNLIRAWKEERMAIVSRFTPPIHCSFLWLCICVVTTRVNISAWQTSSLIDVDDDEFKKLFKLFFSSAFGLP